MASGDCAVVRPSAASAARAVGAACGATVTAAGVAAGMAGVVAAASGTVAVATAAKDAAEGVITGGETDGAGGGLIAVSRMVASRIVVSRNDAAMADSGPMAGAVSSLAKSESMRTLAATALTALPPGGTVP